MLFSNDPELIDLYEEVRLPLTAMMMTFAMAVFLERIPYVQGTTQQFNLPAARRHT